MTVLVYHHRLPRLLLFLRLPDAGPGRAPHAHDCLCTADAVHLTTAQELGERAVWTNDRHMLAAAGYFGLKGESV